MDIQIKTISIIVSIFSFLLFSSCTKNTPTTTSSPNQSSQELKLFTWSEYFDEELVHEFEKETNSKIIMDYFSSNEQLLTKLQLAQNASDSGYDLIMPSDYMVRIMAELNLLQEMDKSKLPFLADFDPSSLHPDYDPSLTHSVPLAIGLTGIAINTKLMPELKNKPLSWKDIFENPKYEGKVTLLDDTKEVLQAVLLMNKKSLSDANEADIKEAFSYLKKHKKQIKAFTSETRNVLESGECAICMAYSGDVLSVSKTKPEIQFTTAMDGASIWTDNFSIPKNAKNIDLAYKFMNKVLSKEGAKAFTMRTGYRTANLKAKEALPKEVSSNKTIYPEQKKYSYLKERKDLALLIDKEWTLLRAE